MHSARLCNETPPDLLLLSESMNKTGQARPFLAQSCLSSISAGTRKHISFRKHIQKAPSSFPAGRGAEVFDIASSVGQSFGKTPLPIFHTLCEGAASEQCRTSPLFILSFTVVKTYCRAEPWSQTTWPCCAIECTEIHLQLIHKHAQNKRACSIQVF